MILATTPVFPNNAVEIIKQRIALLDSDFKIFRRPLRNTDPNQSVGIFAQQWLPDEETYEMRGLAVGRSEPTIQTYLISIQAFVTDFNEENGLAVSSVIAEMIRTMLYRDEPLRIGLSALTTNLQGVTKRTKKWSVRQQRYFSNEIEGSFLYLSTMEFWLETETV